MISPSRIPDHSSAAVDNDTEHHILCFYQGQETFFARIPPYRRGSQAFSSSSGGIYALPRSRNGLPVLRVDPMTASVTP